MSIKIARKSNTMTISSFHEGYILNKYNMTPKYQRKSVWSEEQQSLLIDSILKNVPIPPIFLREKIDKDGKTKYEVVDGKQRLTAIIDFIDGNIYSADDEDDPLHDQSISGISFDDLKSDDSNSDYLDDFWRYPIPIEYIQTKDDSVVDRIFDRLNRSGENLTGQELRHANYYNSTLIKLAYKISKLPFWTDALIPTDKKRMEDIELLSEFIFLLIEEKELKSTSKELDKLYKTYANNKQLDWKDIERTFNDMTDFLVKLDLDLKQYKVSGVSHLYGLWSFVYHCTKNNKKPEDVKTKLRAFYQSYLDKAYKEDSPQGKYKKSMLNATRDPYQRKRRREALVEYCF